jgi:putative colanic acid biosynthesis acetyltransferase WcaF
MVLAYSKYTDWSKVEVPSTTEIKMNVFIDPSGFCIIGEHCVIADFVRIFTHTHPFARKEDWRKKPVEIIHKVIDDHVFIGDSAIILPQCAHIAEGVVIGAGSVVTKNIDVPYTIWAGNPARQIGVRE